MNEKNSILIDEYVDLKENNLENNFQQKCNLNETTPNDSSYDLVEGDDEQTDEDQSKLNKTDTQKRRRKSSGRQNQQSHALHSSSSSLSSWTTLLPESTIMNHNQSANPILNSKKNGNLNSSYDTISEEEHRAKQIREKLKKIDDDIISSSCDDDNNDEKSNPLNKSLNNSSKSSKNKQQQSSDSLSSSPTQKLIKPTPNHHTNKNDQNSTSQQRKQMNANNLDQHKCCLNHHNHYLNNNNNYYINNQQEQKIPWLYNNIQREEADFLLTKFLNVDGVFLVRTKHPDSYVLSFVHDRKIKHCHIKKLYVEKTICYSLDDGKTKFYDLKQLIEFYQLNQYFLPINLRYFLVHGGSK